MGTVSLVDRVKRLFVVDLRNERGIWNRQKIRWHLQVDLYRKTPRLPCAWLGCVGSETSWLHSGISFRMKSQGRHISNQ